MSVHTASCHCRGSLSEQPRTDKYAILGRESLLEAGANTAEPKMPLKSKHGNSKRGTLPSARHPVTPSALLRGNPGASFSVGSTQPCSLPSALRNPPERCLNILLFMPGFGRDIVPQESPAKLGFRRIHLAACGMAELKGK